MKKIKKVMIKGKLLTAKDKKFRQIQHLKLLAKEPKRSIFDLDNDGVSNLQDCDPSDPTKQHGGGYGEHEYLLDGYDVDDYVFTGAGYELQPGAKPSKSWLKEEKKRRKRG